MECKQMPKKGKQRRLRCEKKVRKGKKGMNGREKKEST